MVLKSVLRVGFWFKRGRRNFFLNLEFPDSGTAVGADERRPTRRPPAGIWKTRRFSGRVLHVHEEHEEHDERFRGFGVWVFDLFFGMVNK